MGQINRCGSSAIKAIGETTLRSWQERNTNAGRNNKYSNLNWKSVCGEPEPEKKSQNPQKNIKKKNINKKKHTFLKNVLRNFFEKRFGHTASSIDWVPIPRWREKLEIPPGCWELLAFPSTNTLKLISVSLIVCPASSPKSQQFKSLTKNNPSKLQRPKLAYSSWRSFETQPRWVRVPARRPSGHRCQTPTTPTRGSSRERSPTAQGENILSKQLLWEYRT